MTLMNIKKYNIAAVGIGSIIALLVCVDPVMSNYLSLNSFPYVFSIALTAILILALVLFVCISVHGQEREWYLIFFIIFMVQFSGVAFGKLDILEIGTAILFGIWLIQTLLESDRKIQVSPLSFFILGLFFFSILALLQAPPLTGLVAIGEKFLLFLLIVDLMRRSSLIKTSINFLILTGAFSSVVAIAQFAVYMIWGYHWAVGTPASDPLSVLKPTPFGLMPRSTAFFPNPAGLNDYLLFSLAITMFAFSNSKTFKLKLLYLIVILLMVMSIVITWSTTAIIGLGVVFLLFFYIYRPSMAIHYSASIIFLTIVSYLTGILNPIVQFMANYGSGSGSIRLTLLRLAMESIEKNPIIGIGVQNFHRLPGNIFQEGAWVKKYPIHNAFMQMFTELGVGGGLIFLAIVVIITIRLLAVLRLNSLKEKWVFKGFFLGWIAMLIHMLTEPMAYEGTLWLLIGLIEGACFVTLKERKLGVLNGM